jgi:CBS domain-containing protein
MDNPLAISQLLAPDRIIIGLKAKRYEDAVSQLLDRVESAGLISDRSAIDALVEAEVARGDLPTVGHRTLLAHFRTDTVAEVVVAFATATAPFKFASAGAADAVFLLLIIVPRPAAKQYLKTLATFSELLADARIAESIAAAQSPDEFLEVVASRDLVIRPELTVRDLMSETVHSVSPETPLSETLHLMVRHSRRAVPVLGDSGEVLGMVTEKEILQHFLPQILGTAPLEDGLQPPIVDIEVRQVMLRTVMCLERHQLLSDVVGTMLAQSVSQFPVVSEGRLVGFLSRTDLIHKLLEQTV